MKVFKVITVIIFLVFVSSCIDKTSTPKEYLNQNKVSQETYLRDISTLKNAVASYIDSTSAIRKSKPKSKILSIEIDTIFYGSDDKIVFLTIFKRNNPYVELLKMKGNEEGIDYDGRCFIAIKNTINGDIKIIDKLKYSVGSKEVDAYKRVKNKLRETYFREMEYIDGKYNINDTRFWESDVWK